MSPQAKMDAHALVIGVSRYAHVAVLPETRDAAEVADVLRDPASAGYGSVATLVDAAATREAILGGLAAIARDATLESTVFVYFSGHGGTSGGTCYLLPVDADASSREALAQTAIASDELSKALRAIRADRVTVVLDCCRASGIGEPKDDAALGALSSSALSPLARGRGRAILAASRADGYAYVQPGAANSEFTRHLLDGLRGGANGAGGVIRICDLYDYVQRRVVAANPLQRPVFKAELEENYPVALYRGGAAPVVAPAPAPDAYPYDAFLVYAAAERAWVEGVLAPRLEARGLTLFLESRDAVLGRRRIPEMERAVRTSRYTVAVLSPAYLDGAFEQFQESLARFQDLEDRTPRFLPVMRVACRPELGVRMLAMLDATRDAEVDGAIERLAQRVRQSPTDGAA